MQTLIVVRIKLDNVPDLLKEKCRKKLLKEMKEGLIVIDDNIEITCHTIQGELGIEFNEEG